MWNLQSYPAIVLDERVWHFRGYLTPCTYFRNLKTPNYHHLHPCIFIRSNDLQENRDNKTVHKIISGFNSHNLRAAEYKGYTVSPMQSGCGISAGDVILRSGRMTRGGATVVSGGDWSTWRACLKPLDPQLSCPSLTHPPASPTQAYRQRDKYRDRQRHRGWHCTAMYGGVGKRSLLRPSNYSQARRQGVLSRCPPSLESAANQNWRRRRARSKLPTDASKRFI